MFTFETMLPHGREAERVATAFYRFLELHGAPIEESATMQTERLGELERRTVTLWSAQAVRDFERFLQTFRVDPPAGLLPQR